MSMRAPPRQAAVWLALGLTIMGHRSFAQVLAAEKFDIDPAHSEVGFGIRFMGLTTVHGRFTDYHGTIMYVEADPSRSTVSVLIDARSIDTGVRLRDNDLRGPGFFATDSFPSIFFQSTRIERGAAGFVAHGTLNMRGVTREVALPFAAMHGKMKDGWGHTRIGFAGAMRLNRHDYGVNGQNFWNQFVDLTRMTLADSVDIELTIEGFVIDFHANTFGVAPGKRSLGDSIFKVVTAQGLAAGLRLYPTLKADTATFSTGEAQLNLLGYKLLTQGRVDDAIAVFKVNVDAFPQSSNVYDSLGEAYLRKGDRAGARTNYRRSLELDPMNVGAMEVLRWLP
jgi:polyisoprenoid-binding protein YceI